MTLVKSLASQMIADHEKAHTELGTIAKSKQLPVPAALDAEHAKAVASLRGKSGKDFDTAYAMQVVQDHEKATH